ncbi:MAG: MmcQ/YjbR family DNA-binding protein [Acidobacteria bacterium]|nr:MmcQ/YjbR family DNA-binding protein [Acidobacteriota bacterium]
MKATIAEERLKRVSAICLALPGTTREVTGHHVAFDIRKKTFAYFLDNHHGDGMVGLVCKVLPGDNAALIAGDPARFYMPAYVGPRDWVGLRLDVGRVNWSEAAELIRHSYLMAAPKKLAEAAGLRRQ